MRNIKQNWLLILTAVTMLWFVINVSRAQDAAPTNETTQASVTNETATATNESASAQATTARNDSRIRRDDIVEIAKDAELKADEDAANVVAVFGSAKILGNTTGDVVAVGGDVDLQGNVDGDVVAVFGSIHASSNAVVHGDAVAVGGVVDRAPGAKFHGHVQQTTINLPGFHDLRSITVWFTECVFKMRPLSLRVGWVWGVAGVFFLLYLLIAAVFPQAVRPCVEALQARPVTTLAVGLLGKMSLVIICLLLFVTVIGIIALPFVVVAVIVAFIVGKVAILECLGGGIGKATGAEALQRPVIAFFLGVVIVTLIYTVPILGLLTFLLISAWGFGAAVTAAFLKLRRERPPKPPLTPVTPGPTASPTFTMPVAGVAMAAGATGAAGANPGEPSFAGAPATSSEGTPWGTGAAPPNAPPLPPLTTPIIPTALTFPRGGFWLRMGAGFLDCVLILLVSVRGGPGLFFLAAVAYFAGMIAWKGTTVGGIILRLQVVRTNGDPVSFLVALVRALAAVFSGVVLFLGFFWIGWDSEKQGWHDKIAGTVVVRQPQALSLVCI